MCKAVAYPRENMRKEKADLETLQHKQAVKGKAVINCSKFEGILLMQIPLQRVENFQIK